MAKSNTPVAEVEENDVEELEELEEETNVIRPNDLASELEVDPKRVRAFLRSNFTRPGEAKNTNWELDEEMVEAVRAKFAPSDEDEEDGDDSDEE